MSPAEHDTPNLRQQWLRTLVLADADALARLVDPVISEYVFETLRAPEAGLVLLRARIGGDGDRFNLGEVTATRCVLRHVAPDGAVTVGVGHALGRDLQRVHRIAALDALLQRSDLHAHLQQAVLAELEAARQAREQQEHAAVEATRVRFFTLQAEATP